MRVAFFGARPYDRRFFDAANDARPQCQRFEPTYLEANLSADTVRLAEGHDAVCVFVNDHVDAPVVEALAEAGVRAIALRCAGFNNVDLEAAEQAGLAVVRVPAYSPHAVAEHAVGLLLALDRRYHRAYNRVRESNFALEGLLGFDLHGKTIGVVGTGNIGAIVCRILHGFGCRLLAYDIEQDEDCLALGVEYVDTATLFSESDVVTLHCPLVPQTHHLIDQAAIETMKEGCVLINTSRGALVDTRAVIGGLKSGKIGALGLDVYEEEGDLFFRDLSDAVLQDDVFARLLTFPNVLITAHQAFFTREALTAIAETTLQNLQDLRDGKPCPNRVDAGKVHAA